jgi:two-component system NtrC family sensor kinase
MKVFYIIMLLLTSVLTGAQGQQSDTDSLKKLLSQTRQDSTRVLLLAELTLRCQFSKSDTALILAQQAIALAQRLHFSKGEIRALIRLGEVRRLQGEYPQALKEQLRALQLSRETRSAEGEANSLKYVGLIYNDLGEYRQGLNYLFQSKKISESIPEQLSVVELTSVGNAYENMGMLDSALYFQQKALASRTGELGHPLTPFARAVTLMRLGIIQKRLGNNMEALNYYKQALEVTYTSGDVVNRARAQYQVAELYENKNSPDSSLHYAQLSFANAQKSADRKSLLSVSGLLIKLYISKGRIDSAFYYQQIAMALKDSLFGVEKFHQLQLLALTEQQRVQQIEQRQKEIEQEQERYKNKIRTYALFAILGVFLLLAIILFENNRQKQTANALLQHQKEEIEQQRYKAEKALENLKLVQAQLIQSEKMASLGELTAGIAHEIQNPLNFINNFSEVNTELIDELASEIDKGNIDELKSISNDIKENEQKINHHGKRADAIVKGMLQHSRSRKGVKEPTDINALCDEYLRLSYHGLRAKDKGFSAVPIAIGIETDFDKNIGKVNIIPQDIGRVLLNLFNNAFYAVNEKQKTSDESYKPLVSVQTKKEKDRVFITVSDNGNGILQNIFDKIFQPFFTTKPTGQGTGLGLSLSYDIIKAHGGEIRVETKEGEESTFIINIPTT